MPRHSLSIEDKVLQSCPEHNYAPLSPRSTDLRDHKNKLLRRHHSEPGVSTGRKYGRICNASLLQHCPSIADRSNTKTHRETRITAAKKDDHKKTLVGCETRDTTGNNEGKVSNASSLRRSTSTGCENPVTSGKKAIGVSWKPDGNFAAVKDCDVLDIELHQCNNDEFDDDLDAFVAHDCNN